MTQIEYEIERDNIELAYREKLNSLDNQLREIAILDNDLVMQRAENNTKRIKIQSYRDDLDKQRKEELLRLKKEYLIKGEQSEQ